MSIQSQGTIRRTGLIRRLEGCIADLEQENQILRKSFEESDLLNQKTLNNIRSGGVVLFETAQKLYVMLGAEAYSGDTPLHRVWVALGDTLKEVEPILKGKE